jgi:hypothetical protein
MKNKMKKIFILLFTIISITSAAQDISKGIDSMRKQLAKDMASYDSAKKAADSLMLINNRRFDSVEMARFNEQNSRNLDGLLRTMKEREQKQKHAMWLRLGFGILMLGVLIFGLLRKRRKKNIQ